VVSENKGFLLKLQQIFHDKALEQKQLQERIKSSFLSPIPLLVLFSLLKKKNMKGLINSLKNFLFQQRKKNNQFYEEE